MGGEGRNFIWLRSGKGLEESRLFEQVLFRELRDAYSEAKSPVDLLDRLMRDAFLTTRPRNRRITHSRCVADYLPSRLAWWMSDVWVSDRCSIRSVRFGPWWVPIENAHVPFQFSVQRLVGRWFFEIGERLGLTSMILKQVERLRARDARLHVDGLPRWSAEQRVARASDRPLEGMDALYRSGALHLIEGRILHVSDVAHHTERDPGENRG